MSRRLPLLGVTPGRLAVHVLLLVLVVLWTVPTAGLLISSLRDREQLLVSGWWTALQTTEVSEFGRTGAADEQVADGDGFVLAGNLLPADSRVEITAWSTRMNDLGAYAVGEAVDLTDGTRMIVVADGGYRWSSPVPFDHRRGMRVFYTGASPPNFTLDNYREVLDTEGLGRAFVNTATVTIPATVIPILIAAFAAYAFAWMRFPGRQVLFVVIVGLLVVPLQMSLIPLLRMYNEVGALLGVPAKSYPGIWLAHTGFGLPLAIYLLRNYMSSLPRDIIESAMIEGATHFQIFTRLVLPLSFPALASFAIFQFLWVWNDLLVALVFLGKEAEQIVLTSKLRELLGSYGGRWEILSASAFISIVVPLTVFFALQRFFVRGLVTGSVK